MYVSKKIFGIALGLVFVGAMVALLALLYVELGQANADLRETKTELQQTVADLDEMIDTLTASRAENATLTQEYTAIKTESDNLGEAKADLEDELAQSQAELADASKALSNTEKNLSEEMVRSSRLQDDLAASRAEAQNLATRHEESETRYRELDANYQDLSQEMETLKRRFAADLDALQVRYNALEAENGILEAVRTEIARLERMRQPLILGRGDSQRHSVRCTGSMEPKLTCLDEVTWLLDFAPADIVVGTTISYYPSCHGDWGVAHRVMDIVTRNGTHYFWTKGDNNLEADGCWIPDHNVDAYIIAIHKNVNMENTHLRNLVNGAWNAVFNASANYDERRAEYCGTADNSTCSTWITHAQASELNRLLDVWDRAYDHWECWYQNALDSEYPGHIPYSC